MKRRGFERALGSVVSHQADLSLVGGARLPQMLHTSEEDVKAANVIPFRGRQPSLLRALCCLLSVQAPNPVSSFR